MKEFSNLFEQLRESRKVAPVVTEPLKEEKKEQKSVSEEKSAYVCAKCGEVVAGHLDEEALDACPFCGSDELTEATVKVVRNGEVKKIKKKAVKKRISAAQKAALVKARKKAHTAAAEKQRAKSMKKGRMAGLHEEDLECPECGYEGPADDFALDDDGNFVCPECGAIIECDSKEEVKEEHTEDSPKTEVKDDDALKAMLESVNAPEFVHEALKEGKRAFVAGYLDVKMGK